MISKTPAENAGNMKQLVDQGFGLFGYGETVVIFRDELDYVVGGETQSGLYRLR
jgi:hypothetical protein